MLKLMYITNNPNVAAIADEAGVERIFIDMEYIGKSERQGGMDTVQCHHTCEDIVRVKSAVKNAKIMVRCNPIHEATADYGSTKEEIDAVIAAGADIVMLPYFKTADEVRTFVAAVGGRAKTLPLVETPEAVENIDEILSVDGIDEIFVGLNDLSLGYRMKFMFELLTNGTLERLCLKFKQRGLPYGFGGIASIGKGLLPSEKVIKEHYRLGSTCAILSRSFCNACEIKDEREIRRVFEEGLEEIRALESECERYQAYFKDNEKEVIEIVKRIAEKK